MTDFKPLSDPNETPEDVATLYSWANLHGAKYRDFSAARAQTREKARLRAEQAIAEHRRAEEEALAAKAQEEAWSLGAGEARAGADEAEFAETGYAEAGVFALAPAEHGGEEAEQARLDAHHAAEFAEQEAAAKKAEELAAQQAGEREAAERLAAELEARHAAELAAQQTAEHEAAERAAKLAAEEAREREAAEFEARQAAERAQAEQEAVRRAEEHAAELAAQAQAARLAEEQAAVAAAEELVRQEAEARHHERTRSQVHAPMQPQFETEHFPERPEVHTAAYSPSQQPYEHPDFEHSGYSRAEAPRTAASQTHHEQAQEENPMPSNNSWTTSDLQEPLGRPAWLASDRAETASQPATPSSPSQAAPEDTLQGSRDRLTLRWFALRGIFDGAPPAPEAIPAPVISRAPSMAVFSLAGGVGKTSLVATLGRALSARGERVLLVDTAAFGLLPFFFGATDQRPGQLRTFSPPGVSSDAPVQMLTIDPDSLTGETSSQESLSGEIQKFSRGVSRVIVDLATASGATTRRIMRMSPLVLVPVIPDMNSVVSVSSIDAFFEHNSNPAGKPALPFYVMNQYDASLPLHLDVREVLREQLGERLLPFALRRTPAMSEALAEGMTVMDYAPNSPLAEDFSALAGWVKSLSAPATTSYRGVRWSER